jgi:transcriptional regulator with GAF, ATPase, and Fis domain
MDLYPPATAGRGEVIPSERMCNAFVDTFSVSGASISVFGRDGQQSTIGTSNSLAARAETLQFELGEGPHWEALSSGRPLLVPDLSHQSHAQWPLFSSAARELGIAAVFAFPMRMGAATIGVVDLYCVAPRTLTPHEVALATSMAGRFAAAAAREAMASATDPHSTEHDRAPSMRREVHQATGMIQAQLDTTTTNALARLRAYAFSSGRPIDELAREVVARRLDFSTQPD